MIPTIQTISGRYYNLEIPRPSEICLTDIAHALSNLCRFTGHSFQFYSVAQHSVIVSQIVPPDLAFAALLHDAHEAYVGDMSAPLKELLQEYQRVELLAANAVRLRFGVPLKMPEAIKRADLVALATERRDLMLTAGANWDCLAGIDPLPQHITPLGPIQAHGLFLARFRQLIPRGTAA